MGTTFLISLKNSRVFPRPSSGRKQYEMDQTPVSLLPEPLSLLQFFHKDGSVIFGGCFDADKDADLVHDCDDCMHRNKEDKQVSLDNNDLNEVG